MDLEYARKKVAQYAAIAAILGVRLKFWESQIGGVVARYGDADLKADWAALLAALKATHPAPWD